MPEFVNGLGALHKDPDTQRIKTELLERARNEAVYHIEDALPKLADWVFLHYILGTPDDGDKFRERYASAFKDLMHLSQKLDDAADALIAAYARKVGATYEEYDHAA